MNEREQLLVRIPADDLLPFLPLTRRDRKLLRLAERYANQAMQAWWARQLASVRRSLQGGVQEWFDG